MAEDQDGEKWLQLVSEKLGISAGDLVKPETQNNIVFQNKRDFGGNEIPTLREPKTYEALKDTNIKSQVLTTESGDTFTVWRSETLDPDKKTFVFFPGNGGHLGYSPVDAGENAKLGESDAYLQTLKEAVDQGYNVVGVNYVGYSGSNSDTPNEQKLFAGVEKSMDWLVEQGVKPKDMRISGVSMGTTTSAHAANYLSSTPAFKALPEEDQKISLLMMNGNVTVPDALIPLFGVPADLTPSDKWRVMLDTGKELEEMALNLGKNGNVGFLRGMKDPATPASQVQAHRDKAKGMNVLIGEEPDTLHYFDGKKVFEAFDKMDQGKFQDQGIDPEALRAARDLKKAVGDSFKIKPNINLENIIPSSPNAKPDQMRL